MLKASPRTSILELVIRKATLYEKCLGNNYYPGILN